MTCGANVPVTCKRVSIRFSDSFKEMQRNFQFDVQIVSMRCKQSCNGSYRMIQIFPMKCIDNYNETYRKF